MRRVTAQTTEFEHRYLGETAPRRPGIAFLLALLCPGVGWAYVGRPRLGVALNVGAIAAWSAFVVVWATRQFHPFAPFRAFLAGWFVLTVMNATDVARTAAERGDDYVLRPSNAPLVYVGLALLTFFAPLSALYHVATTMVWRVVPVSGAAMYPTLVDGDRILVDVLDCGKRAPAVGELVLYELEHDTPRFGRVIGVPGDDVAVAWDSIFVNDVPGERVELDDEAVRRRVAMSGEPDGAGVHQVEHLGGASYHILSPARGFTAEPHSWTLGEDEFVVLNDNRAESDDSRRIGPIRRDDIVGRPVFVGYSTDATADRLPLALRALTAPTGDDYRALRGGRRVQPIPRRDDSG